MMTREEFENTHCYLCSSIACNRTDECVEACTVYQKEVLGKETQPLHIMLENELSPLDQLKLDVMRAWIGAPQHDMDMYNDTIEYIARTLWGKGYVKEKHGKWVVKRTFTDAVNVIHGIFECSCCGRNKTVPVYDKRNIVVCNVFDRYCPKCGAKMEEPR